MKYLFLLFVVFIGGCAATKGSYDKTLMNVQKPYIFQYSGNLESCSKKIKRIIIESNFTIENEDLKSGYLVTNKKILGEKETFDMSTYSILSGINYSKIEGRIALLFDEVNDTTIRVTMKSKISAIIESPRGSYSTERTETEEREVALGHPFAISNKNILMKSGSFRDVTDYKP